ncbi:LCP family protein [Actinoplanes sp. DH11]|uniref:LCP family protein n=1 Tax=Actinoplanes sp. DH11 TaxID=2857011 RepID=UPI001E4F589E|nr:LCP family protein [Actinoplanes sp. DH11]
MLIVGIDPRDDRTAPLADTIIVAHVPADRRGVYLFSLPRDLVVRVPGFVKSGTGPTRGKINSAMALGSRKRDGSFDVAQGLELLERTVGEVTGIRRFDAGAVIGFGGFKRMVGALGGVRMRIDQDVVSEHRKPDGRPRDRLPRCRVNPDCLRPYTGPQKVYRESSRPVRLKPWEALDYVRQRYGLPNVDYDRQRHQRQFVRAVAKRIAADPVRLVRVVDAAGDALTVDSGRRGVLGWAAELAGLEVRRMTTLGLRGEPYFEDGRYLGERVRAGGFFRAVRQDRVAAFLRAHPGAVDVD